MPTSLRRLVYRSDSCISHDDKPALERIFASSIRNNRLDRGTGALALPDGKFIQVLEGSETALAGLMRRLNADPRHENIVPLGEWFSSWNMASPDPTPLSEQAFRIVTSTGSGAQVTAIMLNLLQNEADSFGLS